MVTCRTVEESQFGPGIAGLTRNAFVSVIADQFEIGLECRRAADDGGPRSRQIARRIEALGGGTRKVGLAIGGLDRLRGDARAGQRGELVRDWAVVRWAVVAELELGLLR